MKLIPNPQVDYKLEAQILDEVRDLVQTVHLHINTGGYTGESSIRRCVEMRRKRMTTVVGKRIARDIVKHRDPLVAIAFIIEKYFPEKKKNENTITEPDRTQV